MRIRKHDIVMISLIAIVGFLSWYTNYQRTTHGFFTSPNWIFVDGLFYTILSGLIAGYVIAEVIGIGHKRR